MSDPRWILFALLAVLLLSSARLCWQQWRGPARTRGLFDEVIVAVAMAHHKAVTTPMPTASASRSSHSP